MELAEEIKAHLIEKKEAFEKRNTYETYKRIFDFCFALASLPILLPLMLMIGILIKLNSKGPIFFAHCRVGKEGKPFHCLKFRTMIKNAEELLPDVLEDHSAKQEWQNDFKLREDPRVTRVGKILRKYSLDELPQIFNVLRGEMSFVGPRPIIEAEIAKYGHAFKYYQSVRPGITGLWQVSGRNDTDYSKRITLDKVYISQQTLWVDFKILLKTFPAVFSRKGAY